MTDTNTAMSNQADILGMAESDPSVGLLHKGQTLTSLIAMWPGDELPGMHQVVGSMASYVDQAIEVQEKELTVAAPVSWAHRVRVPGHKREIILWCSQAAELPPTEIFADPPPEFRWILGIDGLLDYKDPLTSFADLIRLLVTATSHDTAILDLETNRWHGPPALRSYFLNTQLEPPSNVLWVTQSKIDPATNLLTLETKGLARCGRRDLCIQGLEDQQVEAGVQLLNAISTQSIESPLPIAPATIELGHGANVRIEEAASTTQEPLEDEDKERQPTPLVILDTSLDTPPSELLSRLVEGAAAFWLPGRDQARQRQLAQLTLDHFIDSMTNNTQSQGTSYLIQTSLTAGDAREYVWTSVTSEESRGLVGDLLEDPILDCGPKGGDRMIISREAVEDWRIEDGKTVIVPDNIRPDLIRESLPTDQRADGQ